MRKILLTSSGFETERIVEIFHDLLEVEPANVRALFIPTAALNPTGEGIEVLHKCLEDLLNAGIPRENINVFDLHRPVESEELDAYDTIYVTGGMTQYLLDRINATGFQGPLRRFVDRGGVYVGVSAGSIVAANNLPGNLGYINCTLAVHTRTGTASGVVDTSGNPHIELTGENVIVITGDRCEVLA